jgi:hypothetical protein
VAIFIFFLPASSLSTSTEAGTLRSRPEAAVRLPHLPLRSHLKKIDCGVLSELLFPQELSLRNYNNNDMYFSEKKRKN